MNFKNHFSFASESTTTKKSDSRPALVRSYVNKPDGVVGKLSLSKVKIEQNY